MENNNNTALLIVSIQNHSTRKVIKCYNIMKSNFTNQFTRNGIAIHLTILATSQLFKLDFDGVKGKDDLQSNQLPSKVLASIPEILWQAK